MRTRIFRCFELAVYPHGHGSAIANCRPGITYVNREFAPFKCINMPYFTKMQRVNWCGHLFYNEPSSDSNLINSPRLLGPVTNVVDEGGRVNLIQFGEAQGKFCAHHLQSGSADVALVAIACGSTFQQKLQKSIDKFPRSGVERFLPLEGHGYNHGATSESGCICILGLLPGRYPVVMLESEYGQAPLAVNIIVSDDMNVSVDGHVHCFDLELWNRRENELMVGRQVLETASASADAAFY